jgi:hypothetical protein
MNAHTTTTTTTTTPATRVKRLLAAALGLTVVALLAGAVLLISDPATGSTVEAVLGVAAALSGFLTGVLAIAAVVLAHVDGLWRGVSVQGRYAVLGVAVASPWRTRSGARCPTADEPTRPPPSTS